MSTRASKHIDALDALRGIAILMVMFLHFTGELHPKHRLLGWYLNAVNSGWLGVDLFFVLSGFLISGILIDAKGRPHFFRNFYARRTLRIFPLYYGFLTVVFVIVPLIWPQAPQSAPGAFEGRVWVWTYLSNLRYAWRHAWPDYGWLHLGHFWTLAVEEQFYIIWPTVVFFATRRGLYFICGCLICIAPALRIACIATHQPGMVAYIATPCRMDDLAFGGMLALLVRRDAGLAPLVRPALATAIASGLILLLIFLSHHGLTEYQPMMQKLGYSMAMLASGSALILFLAAPPTGIAGRFCNSLVLRFFGKYSYGLYVLHIPLVYILFDRIFKARVAPESFRHPWAAGFAYLAMAISISLVAAIASWHLYESQFLKLKRYFEYTQGPAGAAPGSLELQGESSSTTIASRA
ncbi:MAG: acyltransferase [Tepidisphaeraceae bacterium]